MNQSRIALDNHELRTLAEQGLDKLQAHVDSVQWLAQGNPARNAHDRAIAQVCAGIVLALVVASSLPEGSPAAEPST